MQHQMEMLQKHIDFLKSLDTEEFYDKDEDEVQQYAHNAIQEIIQLKHDATPDLLKLLSTDFTWSCFFALTVLRSTKDPYAVTGIITFLKKESDDSMANEEAMLALQDIGDPSIPLLIEELEEAFSHKTYNSYIVGALTGIIGPASYEFMVNTTKDFIENHGWYKGWFHIDDFTYNFVVQERQEPISLLKQVLDMKTITSTEKREIHDTIRALEDPDAYQKEIEGIAEELSDDTHKHDG